MSTMEDADDEDDPLFLVNCLEGSLQEDWRRKPSWDTDYSLCRDHDLCQPSGE